MGGLDLYYYELILNIFNKIFDNMALFLEKF